MTTENAQTTSTDKTATVAEQGANVALKPASSKKGATSKQGAPKGQKSAKGGKPKAAATAKSKRAPAAKNAPKAKKAPKTQESAGPREGSKTAQVVALLQRKNGATLTEIMDKMGWQKHTVRGFMAGAMKKAGHAVESFKSDKGERTYRINP
jgi:transglutaminase/protease-like cytokinesis protein 3